MKNYPQIYVFALSPCGHSVCMCDMYVHFKSHVKITYKHIKTIKFALCTIICLISIHCNDMSTI